MPVVSSTKKNLAVRTSLQRHCRTTAVTTVIPLKECSAYGQIDRGGGEKGENYIYELPQ